MKQQFRYMLETLDSIIVGYTRAITIVHLEIQDNYKLKLNLFLMLLLGFLILVSRKIWRPNSKIFPEIFWIWAPNVWKPKIKNSNRNIRNKFSFTLIMEISWKRKKKNAEVITYLVKRTDAKLRTEIWSISYVFRVFGYL